MSEQQRKRRVPREVIFGRILTVLLIALILLRFLPLFFREEADPNALYVYVLDVGQSDAVLLRTGDATMLIDAASATEERALRTALLQYGVRRLDHLVLTHPHEDHIGNARGVLEWLEVGEVLLPAVSGEDDAYQMLCATAKERSCVSVAEAGATFSLGKATVRVLLADGDVKESADADKNANNSGTVLRVEFGDRSLLFMGDAEKEAEAALLDLYEPSELQCDFLKVGHHGSNTSTTPAFLAAAMPQFAAISCGKDNTYGFPHKEVLDGLAAVGTEIYRTDESGTLVFCTDGESFTHISKGPKGVFQ